MNEYINTWLENFERQSMIRRALIISGNIIDLGFNRYNKLMSINRIIEESLKALANHRFHKAKLVKKPYDETEIRNILSYVYDTEKNGVLFDIKKDVDFPK